MSDYTRREFLETGSAGLTGAGLSGAASSKSSTGVSAPPSDRLRFGVIGANGMGGTNLQAHQKIDGVTCTALCDVDRNVLEKRAGELEEQIDTTPDLYRDYRRMLEDDGLAFVIIGTSDHWQTAVGYDMWLGPATKRPFNPNRFHFTFCWYWDYAGGLMTDQGVHLIDYILKGTDLDNPNAVASMGGPFGYPDGARETPDTQQALYRFDDVTMIWEHGVGIANGPYDRGHGVAFVGNNGTLAIDCGGWEVSPEVEDGEYETEALPPRHGEGGLDAHAQNFVASIRGDETPNAPVDAAANTAVNARLGNVAFRVGRDLEWDAEARQFVDGPEANGLVRPSYRDPWSLPSV